MNQSRSDNLDLSSGKLVHVDDPDEVYMSDEDQLCTVTDCCSSSLCGCDSSSAPDHCRPGSRDIPLVSRRDPTSDSNSAPDFSCVFNVDPLLTSQVMMLLIQRYPALAADPTALQFATYLELLRVHRLKMEAAVGNNQDVVLQTMTMARGGGFSSAHASATATCETPFAVPCCDEVSDAASSQREAVRQCRRNDASKRRGNETLLRHRVDVSDRCCASSCQVRSAASGRCGDCYLTAATDDAVEIVGQGHQSYEAVDAEPKLQLTMITAEGTESTYRELLHKLP
jgi:hypothetical protein